MILILIFHLFTFLILWFYLIDLVEFSVYFVIFILFSIMRSYAYTLKFNTFFLKNIYQFVYSIILDCVRQFLVFALFKLYKFKMFFFNSSFSTFFRLSSFYFTSFYRFNRNSYALKHFIYLFFFYSFSSLFNTKISLFRGYSFNLVNRGFFFRPVQATFVPRFILSDFVYSSYILFVFRKSLKNSFFKFIGIPMKFKKFVFLKSPHVHKKAREHLEIRWHRLNVFFSNLFILFNFSRFVSLYGSNFSLVSVIFDNDFKIL